MPDVNEPGTGFLWTNAARHKLTYRSYGEYVATRFCNETANASPREHDALLASCPQEFIKRGDALPAGLGSPPGSPSPFPWSIPAVGQILPTKPELRGHIDAKYPSFNTSYPDQLRADEFLREFAQYDRARRQHRGDQLPNFIVMQL